MHEEGQQPRVEDVEEKQVNLPQLSGEGKEGAKEKPGFLLSGLFSFLAVSGREEQRGPKAHAGGCVLVGLRAGVRQG